MIVEGTIRQKALRFGFIVFLLSQVVPFILIYTAAYLFVGMYVSPRLNPWWGAVEAAFLVVSVFCTWQGMSRIRLGDVSGLGARFKTAIWLGLASLVATGYQWSTRFVPPGTRFGEVYFTLTGVSGVYTLVGVFILVAITIRAHRVPMTPDNHWDAEAANYFWTFQALAALVTYAILYWR